MVGLVASYIELEMFYSRYILSKYKQHVNNISIHIMAIICNAFVVRFLAHGLREKPSIYYRTTFCPKSFY